MRVRLVCVLVLGAIGTPALAQTPPETPRPADRPAQPVEPRAAPASEAGSRRDRLLKAAQLPRKAQQVRDKGVPASEVKEALDAAKAKGVPAGEMSEVAEEHSKAIDQHGRIDNFGAFVKSKLNEGLRGRELAAAIKEEHARRGMGPSGKGKAKNEKVREPKDADLEKAGQGREKAPKDKPDKANQKGKGNPR